MTVDMSIFKNSKVILGNISEKPFTEKQQMTLWYCGIFVRR